MRSFSIHSCDNGAQQYLTYGVVFNSFTEDDILDEINEEQGHYIRMSYQVENGIGDFYFGLLSAMNQNFLNNNRITESFLLDSASVS